MTSCCGGKCLSKGSLSVQAISFLVSTARGTATIILDLDVRSTESRISTDRFDACNSLVFASASLLDRSLINSMLVSSRIVVRT